VRQVGYLQGPYCNLHTALQGPYCNLHTALQGPYCNLHTALRTTHLVNLLIPIFIQDVALYYRNERQ